MLSVLLLLASPQIDRRPAMMVISSPHAIKTVPYRTMTACEKARRVVAGPPAGSPAPGGGIYGPPLVAYTCVPR